MLAVARGIALTKMRLSNSTLIINFSWAATGQVARAVLQVGYFVCISRALGPQRLGLFVGMLALANIFAPFVGLGSGSILIREVARQPNSFSKEWTVSIFWVVSTGIFFTVVVVLFGRLVVLPSVSLAVLVAVAGTELLVARIVELSSQSFQAFEQLREMTLTINMLSISRASAATVFLFGHGDHRLSTWVTYYCAASASAAVASLIMVSMRFKPSWTGIFPLNRHVTEGFYFSLGLSSRALYVNIDKTMLPSLASAAAAGVYGAASKLVLVSFTPVNALLASTYARFFRTGESGTANTVKLATKIGKPALIYSCIASIALYLFAPVVPVILGHKFGQTVVLIRILAIMPVIQCAHFIMGDVLTATDRQRTRALIQLIAAAVAILLNLIFIQKAGAKGAAFASLIAESSLIFMFGMAIKKSQVMHVVRGR